MSNKPFNHLKTIQQTLQLSLEALQRLLKGKYDAELGDEVGGFRWRYADHDAEVTGKASSGRDSKKGREAYLQFRDKLYDPTKPHNYKNENRLRDYQVDGVNWLAASYYNEQGCILADEMGTLLLLVYYSSCERKAIY